MTRDDKYLTDSVVSEEEADEIVAICDAENGITPEHTDDADAVLEAVELEEEVADNDPDKQEYQSIISSHKYDDEDGSQYKKAIFEYCYNHNLPFVSSVFDELTRGKEDSVYEHMPHLYIEAIKQDPRYNSLTFFDQIRFDNFEQIYAETKLMTSLSEDDKRNRQQILNIIGYDPFEENPIEDKPQLYRDLTGMLTDNMRKDIPRAKAAVEVVTGYNNIRKYQNKVNQLINSGQMDEGTQKQLDNLLGMIAKIQASVTSTSEKHGFSSGKTLGSNGRGTLSDVMMTVDEHMYDPGITNFYDIATSQSIAQIADISNKSLMAQAKLTGQEYIEILAEQNKIVHESLDMVRKTKEALRIAKSLIVKDKLIEQLRAEYKKKGISEEDIEEFINREYTMWDGK